MRRRSELRQLLTGMSMRRYLPPMGTAGFDRCAVRGNRRVPRPPPRMTARTAFIWAFRAFSHVDAQRCQTRRGADRATAVPSPYVGRVGWGVEKKCYAGHDVVRAAPARAP